MTPEEALIVLGLRKGASPAAIKSAYRQAAQWCHPDKNPGNKVAEETFKRISEANRVLTEPWNVRPSSPPPRPAPPPSRPSPSRSAPPPPPRPAPPPPAPAKPVPDPPVNWKGAKIAVSIFTGTLLLALSHQNTPTTAPIRTPQATVTPPQPPKLITANYLGECGDELPLYRPGDASFHTCMRIAVHNASPKPITNVALSLTGTSRDLVRYGFHTDPIYQLKVESGATKVLVVDARSGSNLSLIGVDVEDVRGF